MLEFFLGSRKPEIKFLLPIFLQAANLIQVSSKKIQFCLVQASNIDDSLINKYLQKYNKNNEADIKIIKNQNHAALSSSDAVILASGTVTLEAALYKTPMVVSYKVQAFYIFHLFDGKIYKISFFAKHNSRQENC